MRTLKLRRSPSLGVYQLLVGEVEVAEIGKHVDRYNLARSVTITYWKVWLPVGSDLPFELTAKRFRTRREAVEAVTQEYEAFQAAAT